MLKDLLRNKFIQNSAIYATGTILVGALNYVFHFITARQISVAEYGELQSLLSLFAIAGVFGTTINYLIVKYTAVFAAKKDYTASEQFRKWMSGIISKFGLLLFLLFLICIPFIQMILHLSDMWGALFIGGAGVFSLVSIVYTGTLMGWEMFGTANIAAIGATMVKLFVGAGIGFFFPHASFIAFSFFIMSITGWLIGKHLMRTKLTIHASEEGPVAWQEYISIDVLKKSIVPVTIFSLFMLCIMNLDVLLVKSATTADLTGYFGAFKILGNILVTINSAIIAVVLPGACAEGHRGNGVSKRMLVSAYGLISLVSISTIAVYFVFSEHIVSVFFGGTYTLFFRDLWLFGIMAWALSLLLLEANFAYARHDFRILYALGVAISGMAICIFFLHGSISEIAVGISIAFALGLTVALLFRVTQEDKLTNSEKRL